MSFIIDDFADNLIDEAFIAETFAKSPQELLAYINEPNGYSEGFNGFGFKYNIHEANVLQARILEVNQRLDDDLDIVHFDFNDTAVYDNEPSDTGLSASQRNGMLL